jgi:hypothetical protein
MRRLTRPEGGEGVSRGVCQSVSIWELTDETVDGEVRVDVLARRREGRKRKQVDGALLEAGEGQLLPRQEERAEGRMRRVVL